MIKLDTVESEFGTITVFKKKSASTITYEQGGCCQSEADGSGVSLVGAGSNAGGLEAARCK